MRVVEFLEKDGRGLNLTQEVRDGILKHSKLRESIAAEGWGIASTLEGQIVKIADSLAYLAHDIDDAIRAGVSPSERSARGPTRSSATTRLADHRLRDRRRRLQLAGGDRRRARPGVTPSATAWPSA